MPRLRRPHPIGELRSFQFPAWVMFVWVGWLVIVSPALVGISVWLGAPALVVVGLWVTLTVVLYVRTWGRHGRRIKREADGGR